MFEKAALMAGRHPAGLCLVAFLSLALTLTAQAQSLDPRSPTPLRAGENRGSLDCMIGPHYWSFKYHKGAAKISVRFQSMGLFGNPRAETISVALKNPNGKVFSQGRITSTGPIGSLDMPGTFAGPGEAIIELSTDGSCIVRAGGDYGITLSGPAFDLGGGGGGSGGGDQAADPKRIVGTYAVMVCAPDFDCQGSLAIHFSPDGTVETTDGHSGTWKAFDPDAGIYTVVIGRDRWSLKLIPGRGLFNTNDLSVVVFQAVRPG
jgi:hypothetical protein